MRSRWVFIFISICLGLSIGFVGCAKKAVLVQETAAERPAVAAPQAPAVTAEDRAAREKAMKEDELREQERQRAEREKAEREKAERERAERERERAAAAAAPAAAAPGKEVSPLAGLEYIHFDFDKSLIKPEARGTLKKIAEIMQANPAYNLLIEGNCDERGTVDYNLALGERRAMSAKRYLSKLGIDGNRIATISNGEKRPVDPRHNKVAWAKNRNAHFVIKQ